MALESAPSVEKYRIQPFPAWRYTYYEDGIWTPLSAGIRAYCQTVDAINRWVGEFVMYGLFVMMAILTWGVFTNVILKSPAIWVMEMAQFSMAAYYLLGGGYTLQQEAHVRMDVFYERWGPRMKAAVDVFTGLFLLFYLVVLIWGGVSSTIYSLEYNQKNFTAWAPPLAPIKIIMTAGMALMLAQALSLFFKDIGRALSLRLGSKRTGSQLSLGAAP